jgi:hypothetical protein
MHRTKWLGVALSLSLFTGVVSAQKRPADKQDEVVFTDPANAGPDFADQGEYVAEGKWGVQVIAMGDGEFEPVVLKGGLPGAGWDGKSRVELTAKREGPKVVIKAADGFEGSFASGAMSLKTPDGEVNLKKVMRESPRAGAKAPAGATVLFDGTNVDAWQKGELTPQHLLMSGTKTVKKYQDFTLHVEYLLPFKPFARDQHRGNSGIYMQDRYEVQILDTFGHKPEFNGIGSLYRQHEPSVNMCYPPLQWQTYDIEFKAAKFDDAGKKVKNAEVTVNHNGVIVQDHYSITAKTGAGAKEGPAAGAIQLQGHDNPVVFRNVWAIAN